MATRKKYKIVLSEKYIRKSEDGKEWFQFPVNVSGQLVAIQTIIPLNPYTAPDLEQVRKEAYDEGYADAKGGYENGFENGMIVAWDAARKIADIPYDEGEKIFGVSGWHIIEKRTAAETIEKIRQYEQDKEEIKVGDEVERILNGKVDSKAVFLEDDEGYYCCLFWTGCCFTTLSYPKEQFRKTGRHFDEFAAVLKKMRGEQDG